jgi:hypothetical protein
VGLFLVFAREVAAGRETPAGDGDGNGGEFPADLLLAPDHAQQPLTRATGERSA